jgi:hypothetical protein
VTNSTEVTFVQGNCTSVDLYVPENIVHVLFHLNIGVCWYFYLSDISKCINKMSCSEDETNAASVLSQMSQSTQPSDNVITQPIDNSLVAHQCDVETTSSQGVVLFGTNRILLLLFAY